MKHSSLQRVRSFVLLMDWWVAILMLLFLLFCVASIPMVISQHLEWPQTLIAVCILILTALYVLDIALFTSYRLEPEGLVVVSQMRRFVFPYRTIKKIDDGSLSGLISRGASRRFGLSARSVRLTLSSGQYRSITLSPKQRDEFVDELVRRIDEERSARATVVKEGKHGA